MQGFVHLDVVFPVGSLTNQDLIPGLGKADGFVNGFHPTR
jgi:hypothetical protein